MGDLNVVGCGLLPAGGARGVSLQRDAGEGYLHPTTDLKHSSGLCRARVA